MIVHYKLYLNMTNENETQKRIGKVSEAVLLTVGVTGLLAVAVVAPNMLSLFGKVYKGNKHTAKQTIQRSVVSLIRSGLVKEVKHKNGKTMLEVTKRGKWEIFLRHQKIENVKTKTWDKKWRVVVFDVPEEKKKMRIELRRGMVMYGFYMIQKSVWVYPYPCDDFVALLKDHLSLKSEVLYFTANLMEDDVSLRKVFKL